MRKELHIPVDFADVKMDFLALLDGTLKVDLSREADHGFSRLARNPGRIDTWAGGSANQTRDWIRNGYKAPGSPVTGRVDAAPRKRTRWREEGDELSLERAWSGDPTPFASREPGTKAGITINAYITFSRSVSITTVSDYGRWLAQLAAGYAASGHDLNINALVPSEARQWTRNDGRDLLYHISLKKFGQQTDYAAWSPLFAPTGYRHLVFSMWSIDAARRGKTTSSGYAGPSRHTDWGARFDPATMTLTIESDYFAQGGGFPAERMTELVKAAFKP